MDLIKYEEGITTVYETYTVTDIYEDDKKCIQRRKYKNSEAFDNEEEFLSIGKFSNQIRIHLPKVINIDRDNKFITMTYEGEEMSEYINELKTRSTKSKIKIIFQTLLSLYLLYAETGIYKNNCCLKNILIKKCTNDMRYNIIYSVYNGNQFPINVKMETKYKITLVDWTSYEFVDIFRQDKEDNTILKIINIMMRIDYSRLIDALKEEFDGLEYLHLLKEGSILSPYDYIKRLFELAKYTDGVFIDDFDLGENKIESIKMICVLDLKKRKRDKVITYRRGRPKKWRSPRAAEKANKLLLKAETQAQHDLILSLYGFQPEIRFIDRNGVYSVVYDCYSLNYYVMSNIFIQKSDIICKAPIKCKHDYNKNNVLDYNLPLYLVINHHENGNVELNQNNLVAVRDIPPEGRMTLRNPYNPTCPNILLDIGQSELHLLKYIYP